MIHSARANRTRLLGWSAVHSTQFSTRIRSYASKVNLNRFRRNQPSDIEKPQPNPDESTAAEKRLKEIADESHNILIQTKSVFPFQLFPTKLTVDRHKLTIVYRKFFYAEQTVSVPIEDIKNIQADIGPIFGSVTITSDLFINNTQKVDCLHRADVRKIQRLIQGAMVALKEKINISKISTAKLDKLLTDLGEGHTGSLNP